MKKRTFKQIKKLIPEKYPMSFSKDTSEDEKKLIRMMRHEMRSRLKKLFSSRARLTDEITIRDCEEVVRNFINEKYDYYISNIEIVDRNLKLKVSLKLKEVL